MKIIVSIQLHMRFFKLKSFYSYFLMNLLSGVILVVDFLMEKILKFIKHLNWMSNNEKVLRRKRRHSSRSKAMMSKKQQQGVKKLLPIIFKYNLRRIKKYQIGILEKHINQRQTFIQNLIVPVTALQS